MQRLERRLAAVLAIDTAGYSRMMEADVEGTHRRVTGLMVGIVEPAIAAGGGRIVKKTGDGALVEFPSVSEALRAAVTIQREAIAAEAGQEADRQIRFRIGINLGDVIVEPDDIYGDGVNIAARLEGLAQPGDVILSEIGDSDGGSGRLRVRRSWRATAEEHQPAGADIPRRDVRGRQRADGAGCRRRQPGLGVRHAARHRRPAVPLQRLGCR